MNEYMMTIGRQAKKASRNFNASVTLRNKIIREIAKQLIENKNHIFTANKMDLDSGFENGLSNAMLDRLKIDDNRLKNMVNGLEKIASFKDPLNESSQSWQHENGMQISKVSVPLGVIGMIYESRPNVTIDVAGLCIKSGNCVILRGGSEAIHTNKVLTDIVRTSLLKETMNPNIIQLIERTDRTLVKSLITMNDYIDVLIPRGGRGLKKAIIRDASVPIIETGEGLCHTYIDDKANLDMALKIIINAKTQRTGVCNAMETLLVHENIAGDLLLKVDERLHSLGFELRACKKASQYMNHHILANDEDWSTEHLDKILSIKVVSSLQEAIDHINEYGSGHSEAIVTDHYDHAEDFLNHVDASAVYVNASTRFTDGEVFGFGGEIGISTQKLHARGPMGLQALTSYKYIIRGQGQIR